jgi:hypothetical protein
MAAETIATLNGYFKQRYGEVSRAVPSFAELQKRIPFEQAARTGDFYNFPVKLRRSHGTTYAGGASHGTAFALNTPIPLTMKNAQVTGTEFVHQEDIAYGVLSAARSQGEAAFGSSLDEVVLDIREEAAYALEMALLYGGTSIAALASVSGASTTRDWTITNASWAPGLWAQGEGMKVDCYDATLTTKRNALADIDVTAVNADTRVVSVSGNATDLTACVATDVLVPKGAVGNWFNGVDKIVTNTGSLFGIDAAAYTLWKGNSYSASSAKLTMGKLQAALTRAVVRGLMEDVTALVSTYSWTDMNNDLAALRRYQEDTKSEMTAGTNSLKFYGSNGGTIEVVNHPMVKAGEAFLLPTKRYKRVGSSDTTFQLPGVDGQEPNFFQELESSAGVRLRCYWDQALISTMPAKSVKITAIDPESDPA